jgi:hypothetical protein
MLSSALKRFPRTRMLWGLIAVGAVFAAFAAFGGMASAARPSPTYTLTCQQGGSTTLTWKHARVAETQIRVTDETGTSLADTGLVPTSNSKRPNGSVSITTPDGGLFAYGWADSYDLNVACATDVGHNPARTGGPMQGPRFMLRSGGWAGTPRQMRTCAIWMRDGKFPRIEQHENKRGRPRSRRAAGVGQIGTSTRSSRSICGKPRMFRPAERASLN